MSRRKTGALLLVISGLLYASKYLAAAIYGSSMMGWSAKNFQALLQYVGPGLSTWSLISLIAGVAYLLWAEAKDLLSHKKA